MSLCAVSLPAQGIVKGGLLQLAGRRIPGNGRTRQVVRMMSTPPQDVRYKPQSQESTSSNKNGNTSSVPKKNSTPVYLETVATKAPVTAERNVSTPDLPMEHPQIPRAYVAADVDHPEGTPGRNPRGYTVLQQHCAFFDRNDDGIVFPNETYAGFKALGYPTPISVLAAIVINGTFSYSTYDGWIPDIRFPIYLEKVHRTKHGSDTEVYDPEGRFVPYKFEEIWNKFARTKPGMMTYDEVIYMTDSIRNANDPFGWSAAKLEWGFTYWLCKDENGFLSKEAVRGIYDGSFFEYMEQRIKSGDKSKLKQTELSKINPKNVDSPKSTKNMN
ncbi:hypothetical protein R1sor_011973 [Riccia sorocarpa]|uniref:Caleosin n=1 Tax=Riccia sorocarpa TaxID=122646 RepID=A0ABD3I565_9MARC